MRQNPGTGIPIGKGVEKSIDPPVRSRHRRMSGIRARLIILLLVILVPTFFLQAFMIYDRFERRKAEEYESNLEMARAVGRAFESYVRDVLHQELAIGIFLSRPLPPQEITQYLGAAASDHNCVRDFSWLDPEGHVLASGNPEAIGTEMLGGTFLQEISSGAGWAVSDLIQAGEPYFLISRGIRDQAGMLLGIVAATVVPEQLDPLLAIQRTRDGAISLADSRGALVYRHPWVEVSWEDRERWGNLSALKDVYGKEEFVRLTSPPNVDQRRIVAGTPIPSIGWVARAGRGEREAMKPIVSTLVLHGALFALVALTSFFASLALSRSISSPIKRLQRLAVAFGGREVDVPAELSGPAEVRDLGRSLLQAEAALRENERRVKLQILEIEKEIAERKQVEERLRDEQTRLLMAQEAARAGVFEWDLRNNVAVWSGELEALYGLARGEFRTMEDRRKRMHHEDLERSEAAIRSAFLSGEYREEFRVIWPDFSIHWLSARGKVIHDDQHRPVRMIGINMDITELKQTEEALRISKEELETRVRERTVELELKNRELQNFAFIASHDLHEPLRKIQVFGDLLARHSKRSLDEKSRDYVLRMVNAAERMRLFLESLLAYSQVTTKVEPFHRIDLRKSVEEALSNLEVLIRDKRARVEVEPLPTVRADRVQLVQLFQNLIGNALKFQRKEEPPRVRIYSQPTGNGAEDEEVFEIFVQDNGIGFDEKYLDKIFMPFQRLHKRTEYEGIGMGLAICKKIMDRHCGTITARSTPGEGSTFILSLPEDCTESARRKELCA